MATAELKRKPRLSKIECYKAANIKKSVVSPQALCRCSWAHTRLLLLVVLGGHVDSTGCLGARKCQGLGSSRRFVRQRYHPFSWPNLDTPHASQLLSCHICPSLWWRGISPPSQMSRLLVMSMEPCAAWRLRRFEKFFAAKDPFDVMCHHPKNKKNKNKKNKKVLVSFSLIKHTRQNQNQNQNQNSCSKGGLTLVIFNFFKS